MKLLTVWMLLVYGTGHQPPVIRVADFADVSECHRVGAVIVKDRRDWQGGYTNNFRCAQATVVVGGAQ